jgi:hypothetical protein
MTASLWLTSLSLYMRDICGSLSENFNGTRAFLKNFAPQMSTTNLFRLDFVIVTVVGSIVGLIFFNPVGYQQALLAGIGWFTSVQALAKGANSAIAKYPDQIPPGDFTIN